MAKKLKTLNAFYVNERLPSGATYRFCVILKGLRNDVNGNKRYEAALVDTYDCLLLGGPYDKMPVKAIRYTFTGHCLSERDEAEWIVKFHLKAL